jgi:hypothetical protein
VGAGFSVVVVNDGLNPFQGSFLRSPAGRFLEDVQDVNVFSGLTIEKLYGVLQGPVSLWRKVVRNYYGGKFFHFSGSWFQPGKLFHLTGLDYDPKFLSRSGGGDDPRHGVE